MVTDTSKVTYVYIGYSVDILFPSSTVSLEIPRFQRCNLQFTMLLLRFIWHFPIHIYNIMYFVGVFVMFSYRLSILYVSVRYVCISLLGFFRPFSLSLSLSRCFCTMFLFCVLFYCLDLGWYIFIVLSIIIMFCLWQFDIRYLVFTGPRTTKNNTNVRSLLKHKDLPM